MSVARDGQFLPRVRTRRWRLLAAAALALIPAAVGARSLAAAASPGAAASASPAAAASASGHVSVLNLRDPASGRVHAVRVYRPAVPDSSNLPVLYFLHGVPGHAGDPFNAGLAASLDAYRRRGGAPFVVVSPDGNGARTDTEWADASDGRDRLETFITTVVIPAVEGAHPRTAAHRAIAGFSMGGYGAFNIAEHHAALFGQVAAIAGYFHVDDPDGALGGGAATIDHNSPDRHLTALRGMHILLMDGAQDDEPVVRGESQRMAGLLRRAKIPATLVVAPGGHDWSYVASQFPALERFLGAAWG